jgi:hypothetical protein
MIDIVQALDDANLFGPWFSGPSWATWKAVLRCAFALPMSSAECDLFKSVAERAPPRKRVRELWCLVGRRGGKDSIASALAAYFAGFIDWRALGLLRPGEAATALCLATDKAQARIIESYTRAYFQKIELLKPLIERESAEDGLQLSTGASLQVLASNFRGVRGRSIALAVLDECAFWRDERTTNPDVEVYQALVPSLATLDGAMIVGITTPYRRSGLVWQKHKDFYGVDDDDVLIVRGESLTFNPTLDPKIVADAMRRDPAAARAEWGAQFRDDISAFLSRELAESAVDQGIFARPPVEGVQYYAFTDAASGVEGGDSFTAAVSHRDSDGRAILDCLIEIVPPFDPAQATKTICATLKGFQIFKVVGDRYSANWVASEFSRNSISYEASELDRSAVYANFLPLLTSGRTRILDSKRLVGQLCNLERKTTPGGKDRIDHPAGLHDDVSNAACGALVLAGDWGTYDGSYDWVRSPEDAPPPGPPVNPPTNVWGHPFFQHFGVRP